MISDLSSVRPPEVFFVIPTLRGGGAERVMVTLLRHFDRNRITPVLTVVDGRDAVYGDSLPPDVELIDLGCTRVRYAIPKLVRLIQLRRPDIVLSTLSHMNLALALVRSLLPSTTHLIAREAFIVAHGLTAYRFPRLWRQLYRWLYPAFDMVVCQSIAMQENLLQVSGLRAERTRVISNPVDMAAVEQALSEASHLTNDPVAAGWPLRLVAAGRLSFEKGFDILIEAMALLPVPNAVITLLGEGPMEHALRDLAKVRGVADRVIFAGFQRNPFVHFAAADAFVLSSRHEGFPNVVIEALACGTPVIATPAPGGTREILTSIPGCELADAITAEALAGAIERWRSRGVGRIAKEAVASFLAPTIARQYEDALIDVAGRRS